MRVFGFGFRAVTVAVGLIALSPVCASQVWASTTSTAHAHSAVSKNNSKPAVVHAVATNRHLPIVHAMAQSQHGGMKQSLVKGGKARYASRSGGLQCVPFARAATGIELKGNAANWWDAANGVYARGQAPESGSVLNFRANGHMRLGHVAVVARVLSSREIEIDHANWAGPGASKGGVSRSIPVEDVSENNDWSSVRVGLGHSGSYGSVYSTYGFIYDRPDAGSGIVANNGAGRNQPFHASYDEVAEAPARSLR
jgi:surface antigen